MAEVLDEATTADEIIERGQAIYNETLQPILEPEHNGQAVAIHVDSGDYAIARNGTRARHLLRERHPEGLTYSQYIGPLSDAEINLANHLQVRA